MRGYATIVVCCRSEWAAFQEFAASVPEPAAAPDEMAEEPDLERDVSVADEQMCVVSSLLVCLV
jgi:hypothetical protein